MRELCVRLHQKLQNITVKHIDGKCNIANILTKEEKDDQHFRSMAYTNTTPRLISYWNHLTGNTLDDYGNVERPLSKFHRMTEGSTQSIELPENRVSPFTSTPYTASAARGVLERVNATVWRASGALYLY